jgi:hypothetical protein
METGDSLKLLVEYRPLTEGQLSLSYIARNMSGKKVYLFNRLFRADKTGKRTIDKNKIYCNVDGDVAYVSKRLIRVPDGVLVESPEVPYLTQLDPGASFEENLTLATPLPVDVPYLRPTGPVDKPVLCRTLIFTLGYFVAREHGWVRTITKNGENILATDYGFAVQADQAATASIPGVRIPCLTS